LSLPQILKRAQTHVQRGQIDAALKLYKGLLLTFPNHPQVNTELGVLSLHHRPPQDAIKPLEKAVAALPLAFELWVCLLVAHQRCGNLHRAREVLADMRQKGFPEAELREFEQELNEPPPERVEAIERLIVQQSYVSAEIAARLLIDDYPDHPKGLQILGAVLQECGKLQGLGTTAQDEQALKGLKA
jgi:tetratricopeptide (TPR) repeat protein